MIPLELSEWHYNLERHLQSSFWWLEVSFMIVIFLWCRPLVRFLGSRVSSRNAKTQFKIWRVNDPLSLEQPNKIHCFHYLLDLFQFRPGEILRPRGKWFKMQSWSWRNKWQTLWPQVPVDICVVTSISPFNAAWLSKHPPRPFLGRGAIAYDWYSFFSRTCHS